MKQINNNTTVIRKVNNFITEDTQKNTKIEKISEDWILIKNFPSIFGDVINKNGLFIDSKLLEREVLAYKDLMYQFPYHRYILDGHAERNVHYAYSYDMVIGYVEDIKYSPVDRGVYIDFKLYNKNNIFEKVVYPKLPLGISSIFFPIEKYEIYLDSLFDRGARDGVPPGLKNKILDSINKYEGLSFYFDNMLYIDYLVDGKLLRFDLVWMPAYETFITGINMSNSLNYTLDPIKIIAPVKRKDFDKYLVDKLLNLDSKLLNSVDKKIIESSIKYLNKEPDIIYAAKYKSDLSKILNAPSDRIQNTLNVLPNRNKNFESKILPFYVDLYIKEYISNYRLNLDSNEIVEFQGYKPLIRKINISNNN